MPCRKKPTADIPTTANIPPTVDIPPRGKSTQTTASPHATTSSELSHASLSKTNKDHSSISANSKLTAES